MKNYLGFPNLYAIRHIPTGFYLPDTRRGTSRSFVEPMDPDAPYFIPRLFSSRNRAEKALTSWLQGRHIVEWEDGCSYVGQIRHVPSRKREEMEIVKFKLKEITDEH